MSATETAAWLYRSIKAKEVLADPPDGLPDDLAGAYSVQDALIDAMIPDAGPVAGWKVALTSSVMQAMCGVDHPCEGAVLQQRIQQSPGVCDTSTLGRLGIETEIALAVGKDMPAGEGPYSADNVAPYVAAAHAAIELVDDRNADYNGFTAIKLVANNSLNAGIVLGPAISDWQKLDLTALNGECLIDGEVAATGTGADILGSPLNAIAWLANSLNARGRHLRAGEIVMCGSFVRTQFPSAGQTLTCKVESLGEATVTVA